MPKCQSHPTHARAQVVFPLTYVLFNVIYWVVYLYWLPDEVEKFVDLNNIETVMAPIIT